jgi:plasmid stabilization system protein ParE
MAYKITWSPKAERTFDVVIACLLERWTEKQVICFVSETDRVLQLLSKNPYLFRASEKVNLHEVLITKHNLLLYQVIPGQKKVELLAFFDTRRDPKKKHTTRP